MAAPFVQGRLRKRQLSIEILTACAHCERRMRLVVGSNLSNRTVAGGAKPLIFEPEVDWSNFTEPNIIHSY
jgi:hypothetical protein